MIIYTGVGVSDMARALKFYRPLFAELGLDECFCDATSASWGRKGDETVSRFSIGYPLDPRPASAGVGALTAFRAASAAQIDRLYEIALANGGRSEGAPGPRPQYGPGFHGAYVRDPDGNKLAFHYYREG